MVYTERGILKRSVSIMMTNFLKWNMIIVLWFVFFDGGFFGRSIHELD